MIGITYLKANNQIINIVENVTLANDTELIGSEASIKGIDSTLAGVIIFEPFSVNIDPESDFDEISIVVFEGQETLGIGGVLPVDLITDLRDQLPIVNNANSEIILLKQQVADLQTIIDVMLTGGTF